MLLSDNPTREPDYPGRSLLAGGVAALLTSACCVGPLALLMLGVSGAWIAHLTALEPYQPWFISVGVFALLLAGRKIWRTEKLCEEGRVCARPAARWLYKLLFVKVLLLLVASVAFPYIAHWFY